MMVKLCDTGFLNAYPTDMIISCDFVACRTTLLNLVAALTVSLMTENKCD